VNKVYLAGPMGGLTYAEVIGWRQRAAEDLNLHSISSISPVRGIRPGTSLDQIMEINGVEEFDGPSKGFMRDFYDVERCDLVLAHYPRSMISVGTICEMAWAYQLNIPIILSGKIDMIREHMFISSMVLQFADSLSQGIERTLDFFQEG